MLRKSIFTDNNLRVTDVIYFPPKEKKNECPDTDISGRDYHPKELLMFGRKIAQMDGREWDGEEKRSRNWG